VDIEIEFYVEVIMDEVRVDLVEGEMVEEETHLQRQQLLVQLTQAVEAEVVVVLRIVVLAEVVW